MHADHREAQEPKDTLSLILMINQRFHLNSLVEESTRVECTNHHDEDDRSRC